MNRYTLPWFLLGLTYFLLLFVARDCRAQEVREAGLHIGSAHFGKRQLYAPEECNVNPGVYAMLHNGVTLGAYRSSQCRAAAYAGYTMRSGPWALTLGVGGPYEWFKFSASGSQIMCSRGRCGLGDSKQLVLPLVVPSVRVGDARLALVLADRPAIHLMWVLK